MPRIKYQGEIVNIDTLTASETTTVLDMVLHALEKPVPLFIRKVGWQNYPLFFPAMKNGKNLFSRSTYGEILSMVEMKAILKTQSPYEFLNNMRKYPLYAKSNIRLHTPILPDNSLLRANVKIEYKKWKGDSYMTFRLSGSNTKRDDKILQSAYISDINHNLAIIADNLYLINDYVNDRAVYHEKIEQLRQQSVSHKSGDRIYDNYPDAAHAGYYYHSSYDVIHFLADWYWQARWDEFMWSTILDRPVDFIDPGDIAIGMLRAGRHLGEMSAEAIGQLVSQSGDQMAEVMKGIGEMSAEAATGIGEGITKMFEGGGDALEGLFKGGDDETAGVLVGIAIIVGGILVTGAVIYGGIKLSSAISTELKDTNLIYLKEESETKNIIWDPEKSRLPIRQMQDPAGEKPAK